MGPLLQATRTVPIVFNNVADPVGAGFIESMAQPGGNATGFLQFEYSLCGKWLELLKQIAPTVTRAAVLRDPDIAAGIGQFADECLVVDICVDLYLWALYERTPKEDTIKELERRNVTVKRKGKMVTVARTFTKLVDEDFGWKDPKAAERAGMSMMEMPRAGAIHLICSRG